MNQRRVIRWGLASLALLSCVVVAIRGRPARVAPLPVPLERILETLPPSEPSPGKTAVLSMGAAAVPALLQTLQSRRWYESGSVQHLRQRFPRALGGWVRDAEDAVHCRRIAAWLLGELGPAAEAAAPALQHLAASPGTDGLHSLLVLALVRIEPHNPVAFSNAAALLVGTNQHHRYYATLHLGALTNHPGMDPRILIPALSDSNANGWVRANAAYSLAGFGPRARDAAPRLRELLHDPHPVVGANAAYALASVSPADEAVAAAAFEAWVRKGEPAPTTVTQFFQSRGIGAAPPPATRPSGTDQ